MQFLNKHRSSLLSQLRCCCNFYRYFYRISQCFFGPVLQTTVNEYFISCCSNSAVLSWLRKTPTHICLYDHTYTYITCTLALTKAKHLSSVPPSTFFHSICIQAILEYIRDPPTHSLWLLHMLRQLYFHILSLSLPPYLLKELDQKYNNFLDWSYMKKQSCQGLKTHSRNNK